MTSVYLYDFSFIMTSIYIADFWLANIHPQPRLLCVSKASSVCLWWEPKSLKSEYHWNTREEVPEVHGQVVEAGVWKLILSTFIMSLLHLKKKKNMVDKVVMRKKYKNDRARGVRWQREGTTEGCDDLSRCWTKRWNAEWEKATGAWKDVEPKDNLCDCAGRRTARVGSRKLSGWPSTSKGSLAKAARRWTQPPLAGLDSSFGQIYHCSFLWIMSRPEQEQNGTEDLFVLYLAFAPF